MKYRAEIDCLRSLAVVPVILGHTGLSYFKGGFVGVDIFFVISGYLITTIIVNDVNAGNFSIVNFYERRIRRIIPALLLVMVTTIPFAYLWMMPDEFKNFGQSLVATSLFSNNILLAFTSDYWSLASIFKPLLHTWSLGVEEQFYVFFPPPVALLCKILPRHTLHVIAVLFLVSLGTATWGVLHYSTVAFYILPTRAWELLAGTMAAYWLIDGAAPMHLARANKALTNNLLSARPFVHCLRYPCLRRNLSFARAVDTHSRHRLAADHYICGSRYVCPPSAQHAADGRHGPYQLQPLSVAPTAVCACPCVRDCAATSRGLCVLDRRNILAGLSHLAFCRNAVSQSCVVQSTNYFCVRLGGLADHGQLRDVS